MKENIKWEKVREVIANIAVKNIPEQTLEHFFRKSIYLETFVKVDKDWRSSDKELKNFGYQLD